MDTNAPQQPRSGKEPPEAPVKSATDARQGVISGRVVTVLIISVLLSIIAVAGSFFFVR